MLFHISQEMIQIHGNYTFEHSVFEAISSYANLWQLFDIFRILLQILYVQNAEFGKIPGQDTTEDHWKRSTIIFTWLIFISFMSLLGSMRIFRAYRIFIDSVLAVFKHHYVCLFMVVLVILTLAFTFSFVF